MSWLRNKLRNWLGITELENTTKVKIVDPRLINYNYKPMYPEYTLGEVVKYHRLTPVKKSAIPETISIEKY